LVTKPCSFPLAGAGRAGGWAGTDILKVNEKVHRPIVSSNPVSHKSCVSRSAPGSVVLS